MDIQSRAVNLMKWSLKEQLALPDVTCGQQVPTMYELTSPHTESLSLTLLSTAQTSLWHCSMNTYPFL